MMLLLMLMLLLLMFDADMVRVLTFTVLMLLVKMRPAGVKGEPGILAKYVCRVVVFIIPKFAWSGVISSVYEPGMSELVSIPTSYIRVVPL